MSCYEDGKNHAYSAHGLVTGTTNPSEINVSIIQVPSSSEVIHFHELQPAKPVVGTSTGQEFGFAEEGG